jgi:hypothetical protein
VKKTLKRPRLEYVTVAGIEVRYLYHCSTEGIMRLIDQYLLEIPIRDAKTVPPKWVKISQ